VTLTPRSCRTHATSTTNTDSSSVNRVSITRRVPFAGPSGIVSPGAQFGTAARSGPGALDTVLGLY
jgi:hypothetical protein